MDMSLQPEGAVMKTRVDKHWFVIACCALALTAVLSSPAITVRLRDGTPLVGEVVAKDDTNLVLKTVTGTQTIAWRNVSPDTLKALHPDLYARLKAQAEQRARDKAEQERQREDELRAQGMVKVDGKWLPKAEATVKLLRRVSIKVSTRETSKVTSSRTDFNTTYSRQKGTSLKCQGEITVELTGLDPKATHELAIKAVHYRRGVNADYSEPRPLVKTEPLTGNSEYTVVATTPEYDRTRTVYVSSYSGASRTETGYETEGYDISISLDGTLIYEQKKGQPVQVHHVEKR